MYTSPPADWAQTVKLTLIGLAVHQIHFLSRYLLLTIPLAMNGDLVSLYLFMTLVAVTLGTQVTNKYMSYGNTMWGGDITNCVSTSVLSSETGRGESHRW